MIKLHTHYFLSHLQCLAWDKNKVHTQTFLWMFEYFINSLVKNTGTSICDPGAAVSLHSVERQDETNPLQDVVARST
jgi:hypothetical protein